MKKLNLIIVIVVGIVAISMVSTYFLYQNNKSTASEEKVTTKPFLWRIEGTNPSYLYGSIHLADLSVLTLPDIVSEAINNVDTVYTEIKLDMDTQLESYNLSVLPQGQLLVDLLPPDVFDRLNDYLESKNITTAAFSNVKIWTAATTLTVLEDIENLRNNLPLDNYIWDIAVTRGKNAEGLETVKQQVDIFDTLTIDEQTQLLNETIDQLEEYESRGESLIETMLDAYLEGDLELLQQLDLADYNSSNPLDVKLMARLITDRNYNLSQEIADLITNNPGTQYFFTIGAGHYYGDDGIIAILEEKGFTVTRVEFTQCGICSCSSGEEKIGNRCYIPYG